MSMWTVENIHQKLNGTLPTTPKQVARAIRYSGLGSVQWVLLEISWKKNKCDVGSRSSRTLPKASGMYVSYVCCEPLLSQTMLNCGFLGLAEILDKQLDALVAFQACTLVVSTIRNSTTSFLCILLIQLADICNLLRQRQTPVCLRPIQQPQVPRQPGGIENANTWKVVTWTLDVVFDKHHNMATPPPVGGNFWVYVARALFSYKWVQCLNINLH